MGCYTSTDRGISKLRPIVKGIVFGAITVVAYLTVVSLTTPALAPVDAISAAFQLNAIIIIGMGAGIGLQMYLSAYGKRMGCRLNVKRKTLSGNAGGIGATSFFSFFSLVPLGCCGWWLYVLSLLPSIMGTASTAVLIEYSQPLAYLGLLIIFGFNAVTIVKLRKEMAENKKSLHI